MTYISAAAEVITQSESKPEAAREVEMSDPWPSLVMSDGNISPSSDSGLGSEDEQLSHLFENLGEAEVGGVRPLYELTRALTIDTGLTTPGEITHIGDISHQGQDSSCESEASESLSLLLTSQNPSRIDVKTLKRSKVSKSQFQDYCISHLDSLQSSPDQMTEANQDHPPHHDSLEDDAEFCDKKLLAINHLYNTSSEAILSVRGTVRGIRNRVRAGIKTFAPEKSITNEEYGQCVMYVTTLGIVRNTKARCSSVRKILRNLSVRVYEKDVFMSVNHCMDLKQRLGSEEINLPQIFVHGHLLGDADTVEQLNESGELRQLLRPFQDPDVVSSVCDKCGGYGMYPCTVCEGSRRSSNSCHRNGYVTLRCTQCDKGGLMLCDRCN